MAENVKKLVLCSSNLIDAVQNETAIWDTRTGFTEDQKECAWLRIAHMFGLPTGKPLQLW